MSLHYVAFASLATPPLAVAARLRLPSNGAAKHPAVILLHGSAGPSGREGGYADALDAVGIATLEPDLWAARKFAGGAVGRPRPADALADLYGARAFLAGHPAIDATRIGVAGFSFGGVMAMLAATRRHNDAFLADDHFAAIMAVYPSTWIFNHVPGFEFGGLVDAPLVLMTGALDQYDNDPEVSAKLLAGLAPQDRAGMAIKVMPDCHHGFDMPGVDMQVNDPFGNQGKGGEVIMRHNPDMTREAHRIAAYFFRGNLILERP